MASRPVIGVLAAAVIVAPGLAFYSAESAPVRRARAAAKPAPKKGVKPVSYARDIAPVLAKSCGACHGPKQAIAGVNFAEFKDEASVVRGRSTWERVAQSLASHHMPPKNMPQPTQAEREKIVGWIQAKLSQVDCDLRDPGRVTMRRLNRVEYNNTIRDLLRVDFKPAEDFPSDDVGYGFDNIGDVLTISPLLMEKYLTAAEKVSEQAIVTPEPPTTRLEAERGSETGGDGAFQPQQRFLAGNGQVFADYPFPAAGEYILRVRAYGDQAGSEPAKMAIRFESKDVAVIEVTATAGEPRVYETKFTAQAGKHRVAAAFINDFYQPRVPPKDGMPGQRQLDRNLAIDYLEIVGPLDTEATQPTESHKRLLTCTRPGHKHNEACARFALTRFATRAYRRPATTTEIDRLVRIVKLAQREGDSFERGMQLALQAVLVSPHFLFRVELDPRSTKPASTIPVNDYELASRLSYFLWSSMPDDELLALAEKGKLKNPTVLQAQAARMLKDPKSRALVQNFGLQWLTLRSLQGFTPDPKLFPAWSDQLRADLLTETELFFDTIMREDRSVLEFLDGKFTFLNERLAKHYGIPGVTGDQFRKVALTGDQRGGILTHGSVLAVTSNPTRTSPVKRGKWVLENLLNTPPPAPPPNVPQLEEVKDVMLQGTLRQRMEQHRKDPMCASCHTQMDAIGFGLENFDAIGAWRDQDGGAPIDASGELAGGKTFKGPLQLAALLKTQKEQFTKAFTEKLLTYALGRGLENYDRCSVTTLAQRAGKQGYRFTAIVNQIVTSEPFRMRRGDAKEQARK